MTAPDLATLTQNVILAKTARDVALDDAETARRDEVKARNRATDAERVFQQARDALNAELDR